MHTQRIKYNLLVFLIFLFPLAGICNTSTTSEKYCYDHNLLFPSYNIAEGIFNEPDFKSQKKEKSAVDCTITIKGDGVELQVTFHDVSWLRCATIKVGKWLKDVF